MCYEQHLQLQQYCVDLRSASQEIQGFLERAETENVELLREVEEMREVLEAHHLDKAKHEKRNSAQVDFFITGSASLAEELEALEVEEKEEVQTSKEDAKDDGVDTATSETPAPAQSSRRKKPMLRRSSSSVAASKLAALQEEYEEKFEDQSQQLQTAILNKERIERDKQEAINALQKQIEELKGKLPAEKGGDALAGLFQMMSRIKELTTEASDAVLLGFLPPERRKGDNPNPKAERPSVPPVPKAEALKFSSVASSAAVRSRLQGRREKKRRKVKAEVLQDLESLEGIDIHGRISFRAPQWLPHSGGHGRWLVPRDRPRDQQGPGERGRVSLALVDPITDEVEIVCEHLPSEAHFSGTNNWVAWCGLHDERGHGGVFARRIRPTLGPPLMVFTHPNRVEGMTWGENRLALLVHAPNCLVWTVWDAEAAERQSGTIRDNHVDFVGIYGATLLEVHFKPIWFTLTHPQPIERDCVISEDKIQRVKILAGRQKTAEVREEFEDGPLKPENMVCSNSADDQIGKFVPNELNFVFDGLMKFTFALKNSSFSRTVRLRLAQGSFQRVLTAGNSWWIASKDCNVSLVAKTLICNDIDGKGQMGIKSDGNYDNFMFRQRLTVAPQGFVPNRVFSGRVLPFFDQFERRLRFWNPGNDALVYADADSEVWVQPFPRDDSSSKEEIPARPVTAVHPLSSLSGAEELKVAPPRFRIAHGSFACWSPI
eukprot:symbB.v1.2.009942.t1/scaffold642.1/size177528/5